MLGVSIPPSASMIPLEELGEFRKVVILMAMAYYSKRIEVNLSKGNGHIQQSPRETRRMLPVVPS